MKMIKRPSLSLYCRSPLWRSTYRLRQLSVTSLPTLAHSLFLLTPWPLCGCCLSWWIQCDRRQRGQRFCWYHSTLIKSYSWFFVTEFWSDAIQKFLKINLSSQRLKVSNHVENGGVFRLKAETLHGWFEFSGINFSGGFSVKEVEGLSEFFDLIFSEPWSLDFLFGWSFDSWLCSSGHTNWIIISLI